MSSSSSTCWKAAMRLLRLSSRRVMRPLPDRFTVEDPVDHRLPLHREPHTQHSNTTAVAATQPPLCHCRRGFTTRRSYAALLCNASLPPHASLPACLSSLCHGLRTVCVLEMGRTVSVLEFGRVVQELEARVLVQELAHQRLQVLLQRERHTARAHTARNC